MQLKTLPKGKVERTIRFLRERFLAGRVLRSIEQGNRELQSFIDDIAHARPHPTQQPRTVADCLIEERRGLLTLPTSTFATDVVTPVAVDKTAFVRFDTNCYSVPSEHVKKTLTLAADDRVVRVIDGDVEVARHTRSWGKRRVIELPEHRERLVEEKRAARESKGRDRLQSLIPDVAVLYERWVLAGRNIGNMTMQVCRLLDLYGAELLAVAVRDVVARGTHDPGALAVLCEQRRKRTDRPVPIDIDLGAHVPERDVVPHDLESYDAKRRRD